MPLSQTYNPSPYYGPRAGAGGVGRAPTPWAPHGVDEFGAKLPAFYEHNGRKYKTEGEMQDARSADLQKQADATGKSVGTSWGETFYPRTSGNPYAPGGGGGTGGAGGGSGTAIDFNAAYSQIPDNNEPWIGGPSDADISGALNSSYARAKERSGLEAQGAARSIRALMGRRGLGGSRFALGKEAGAIQQGQAQLGEYNRDEAIQLARRKAQVGDMTYGGNITQRGQNMGQKNTRTQQALSLAALQAR
jgi:hypothetical protein